MSLEFKTKQYKLEDLCLQITDGKHGDCQNQENSGYYFVSVKDIDSGVINYENARQITKTDFLDTDRRTKLENEDILITNSGTIGKMVFVNSSLTRKTTFQKSVAIIKPNKELIVPKFLYYYLLYQNKRLIEFAAGTTQKNLLLRDLRNFEVEIPSKEMQNQIIIILNLIDKKINNLKQLNNNLDKIIRTLYNYWFVDFLPFQSNDFKDTYMGKIPINWEIKNLNEICDKISDSYKPESEEVVLLQTSDISKGRVLNHEKVPNGDYKGHFKYKFEKNDILYTQIRPKNERYAFINFNPINYVASTQLMVLRAKPDIILPYILYLFLTSPDMIKEVNLLAESRSGTFPQINFNEIKHEKVVIAPLEVYKQFWKMIESFVEEKFIIEDEIKKLEILRDILLPKLMSGEIDVSEVNCDLD